MEATTTTTSTTTHHVISIVNGGEESVGQNNNSNKEKSRVVKLLSLVPIASCCCYVNLDTRKTIHSIKVGVSLVLVSLFYLLNPLFDQVGENAMWAIMTVVVTFEFYPGATLGKGINRGLGTILGGAMGVLTAIFAQTIGGIANSIIIAILIFVSGSVATYFRLVPSIKKRYDYGVMIFILTFNLVAVSGVRVEDPVWEIARQRLLTIVMGFIVCVCVNIFVFPLWASDELHHSLVTIFFNLANTIQGCLLEQEEDAKFVTEKEKEKESSSAVNNKFSLCNSVLDSKSKHELLANFAKWEPWHGKFGFSYPWEKYLKIGQVLRELAAFLLTVGNCLQASKQVGIYKRYMCKSSLAMALLKESHSIQLESWEAIGSKVSWALRELGDSIKEMRKLDDDSNSISTKLKAAKAELSLVISMSKVSSLDNEEVLAIASFVLLLSQVLDKVDQLVKEVDELGHLAAFPTH
nr:aluminum-activated malate transporter 2 [Arachis hypogaea]